MNVENLIQLVRNEEAIFNANHPNHRDQDIIANIWRNIARKLNISDPASQHGWKSENVLDNEMVNVEDFQEALQFYSESQQPQHEPQNECCKILLRRIRTTNSSTRSGDLETDKQHPKTILKKVKDDEDPDAMFLRSLLPFIKKLGPIENLEFKGETIALLKRKVHLTSTLNRSIDTELPDSSDLHTRPRKQRLVFHDNTL